TLGDQGGIDVAEGPVVPTRGRPGDSRGAVAFRFHPVGLGRGTLHYLQLDGDQRLVGRLVPVDVEAIPDVDVALLVVREDVGRPDVLLRAVGLTGWKAAIAGVVVVQGQA